MRPSPGPTDPHIVIAGGGFGGLESVLHLRRRLAVEANITLISTSDRFVFRPYLTYLPFGVVPDRIEVDLRAFAQTQGVHFLQGRVQSDGPGTRALEVGGRAIPYDLLVIATGARLLRPDAPGLSEHGLVVGDQGDLLRLRERLQDLLEQPEESPLHHIVLAAPHGSQWTGPLYELAFMIETWLRWRGLRDGVSITLATSESSLMEETGFPAHEQMKEQLATRGIEALTGRRIRSVEPDKVLFADGLQLPYDILLTTGHCAGSAVWQAWPVDSKGFLKVAPHTRQVIGTLNAYAVGDATNHPVKQACQALFQADVAADQIVARLNGIEPGLDPLPDSFWILEQLDQALLFQTSAEEGAGSTPGAQVLSVGDSRRLDLSHALHRVLDPSNPLYAGLLWKGIKSGLGVLPFLTHDDGAGPRMNRDTPGSMSRPI